MDTPCMFILLVVANGYTLHAYTAGAWERVHPACIYCWDRKEYLLYVQSVGSGKEYTLHVQTVVRGKGYILHVQTVNSGNGYTLACPYTTAVGVILAT
jgi:hypothetical protein